MKGDAKVIEYLNRGLRHELAAINQYWLHYRLLDNWGLVHVLFHRCPALVAKANGWRPAPGHTLAELAPAPAFERLFLSARLGASKPPTPIAPPVSA